MEKNRLRELAFSVRLEDCEIQTFSSGGPGGQNQNRRSTGVRIIHHPSGARGECREERSQLQNKKKAFRRMADSPLFKGWVAVQLGRIESDEAYLERQLKEENIKTEVREDGKWTLSD
jgi:protein subunit release factor B